MEVGSINSVMKNDQSKAMVRRAGGTQASAWWQSESSRILIGSPVEVQVSQLVLVCLIIPDVIQAIQKNANQDTSKNEGSPRVVTTISGFQQRSCVEANKYIYDNCRWSTIKEIPGFKPATLVSLLTCFN